MIIKTERSVNPSVKKKAPGALIKKLAEEIMLQSLEDLWVDEEKTGSIVFFSGEPKRICSKIVGMSSDDKVKILNMVRDIISNHSGEDNRLRRIRNERDEVYQLVR